VPLHLTHQGLIVSADDAVSRNPVVTPASPVHAAANDNTVGAVCSVTFPDVS
jgi:hypothetical protein